MNIDKHRLRELADHAYVASEACESGLETGYAYGAEDVLRWLAGDTDMPWLLQRVLGAEGKP